MLRKRFYLAFISISVFTTCVMANNELPDPTKPADYQKAISEPVYVEVESIDKKISWRVSAIRISPVDRTAILNGELVRVGDEIGSGEILEINPLSVVLNHNDQKLIVRLFNSIVKKEVAN